MDEETITRIFSKLLASMNQKISDLTVSLHEKLNATIQSVELKYKSELESRDKLISELFEKNDAFSKECTELKEKLKSADRTSPCTSTYNHYERHNIPEWNEVSHATIEPPLAPKVDLLVIGDSIVSHLDVDRLNPGGNNKLICKRGCKVEDIRNALMVEAHSTEGLSHCIVHVGSNHAPEDPPHILASKILSLLKEIRMNMPRTAIHFSAILPKYGDDYSPGINFVDSTVRKYQHSIGYSFIDHPNFLWNDDLICSDGVHPSYKGVAQLAMDIRRY